MNLATLPKYKPKSFHSTVPVCNWCRIAQGICLKLVVLNSYLCPLTQPSSQLYLYFFQAHIKSRKINEFSDDIRLSGNLRVLRYHSIALAFYSQFPQKHSTSSSNTYPIFSKNTLDRVRTTHFQFRFFLRTLQSSHPI